jgi:ABC-type transport system involved in multi-copper enzyme maturation permease subunit
VITTLASHQLLSLRRQRVAPATVGVMAAVTALAGVLGWSSHRTIVGVYDESVKLLAARGQPAPPNPFLVTPSLSMLSNMVIYITMIGALVAIVAGHLAVADDENGGVSRLVFSRQVSRPTYTIAKIVAVGELLAATCAACTLVSIAALTAVKHTTPTAGDMARLFGFFTFSWLYLMVFALVGAVCLLLARRRSLGLLAAIGVWIAVTFALPQFTSGLRPTQSLNPIVDPVSTSQTFFRITAGARPYSVAEQFKEASGRILATTPPEPALHTALRIAPVLGAFALLVTAMFLLVARHDYSRSNADA